MTVIRELDSYVHTAHTNACGAVLDEELAVLLPFLQGCPAETENLPKPATAWLTPIPKPSTCPPSLRCWKIARTIF